MDLPQYTTPLGSQSRHPTSLWTEVDIDPETPINSTSSFTRQPNVLKGNDEG